jgi:hypothetical protein
MFWTDEDNRRLVAEHFPWFLETYDDYMHQFSEPMQLGILCCIVTVASMPIPILSASSLSTN